METRLVNGRPDSCLGLVRGQCSCGDGATVATSEMYP